MLLRNLIYSLQMFPGTCHSESLVLILLWALMLSGILALSIAEDEGQGDDATLASVRYETSPPVMLWGTGGGGTGGGAGD